MLLAYVDESYTDDWFTMAALLVDGPAAVALADELLERVDEYATSLGDYALVIADEVDGQAQHRADLSTYRDVGTAESGGQGNSFGQLITDRAAALNHTINDRRAHQLNKNQRQGDDTRRLIEGRCGKPRQAAR